CAACRGQAARRVPPMMLSTWLPRSATGIGFLLRRPQRSSADGVVAFSPVRFRPSGLASSPTGALSLGGGAGGLAGAPPRGSSLGANQRARPDAHGARAESPLSAICGRTTRKCCVAYKIAGSRTRRWHHHHHHQGQPGGADDLAEACACECSTKKACEALERYGQSVLQNGGFKLFFAIETTL